MMLRSTLLPLAFSYPATALRSATSSSSTKPCANHIVTVLAWALTICGRARVQAAARPTDPFSSERRVKIAMVVSSPVRIAHLTLTLFFCFDDWRPKLGGQVLSARFNTHHQWVHKLRK